MARILTEHLESGMFSEARVLTHNFSPNNDTGIKANIRDSATYGVSGDGSRRWLQMGNTTGENWVDLQLFADYSEVYGEVWFYSPIQMFPNADQIFRFYHDIYPLASPLLTTSNKWAPFVGTAKPEGSLIATWGVWHCLEFYYKIDPVVGEFTGKIDGADAFSFIGDTVVSGQTSFNILRIFTQFTAVMGIDGIVLNDTTGGADDTWPGIILCASRDPITDMTAHNEWSVTGIGNKYPKVSEYPDDPATYIYSVTNAQKQGFLYPAFNVPANSLPISVITEDNARKISAGQIKQGQRLAGVENETGAKDLGVDYKIIQNRQILDPNGDAWTLANANASESFVESVI